MGEEVGGAGRVGWGAGAGVPVWRGSVVMGRRAWMKGNREPDNQHSTFRLLRGIQDHGT